MNCQKGFGSGLMRDLASTRSSWIVEVHETNTCAQQCGRDIRRSPSPDTTTFPTLHQKRNAKNGFYWLFFQYNIFIFYFGGGRRTSRNPQVHMQINVWTVINDSKTWYIFPVNVLVLLVFFLRTLTFPP